MTVDLGVPVQTVVRPPDERDGGGGRIRHPGDVMRLVLSGLALAGILAMGLAAPARLFGPRAGTFATARPQSTVGHMLVGAVQVVLVVWVVALAASVLRQRRFRVLGTTALTGVAAGALFVGLR